MSDRKLDEIEQEAAARRLKQLRALEEERSALVLVEMYPTMHTDEQKAHAQKRLTEIRSLIEEEQEHLASLRGDGLAERQLHDARRMIEANVRMADATADAARAARRAAFWTAVAALGSLVAALAALAAIVLRT